MDAESEARGPWAALAFNAKARERWRGKVRYALGALFRLAPVDCAFSPVRFRWRALYIPVRMARLSVGNRS